MMKRIRVILTVLVAGVLAAGTIVERLHPDVHIYSRWWFIVLMALVAIAALVAIVEGKMWRRPSLLLVHASVAVILLGGGLTTWTGRHGSVTLQPGVPAQTFAAEDGTSYPLPFSLTLERFEVVPYAGTRSPMDFVSHVTVEDQPYDISMNHILRHRGYRFYQEDYDEEGNSTLSVARDPWGIGVTYCGYALLLLGLLGLMVSPQGRFRTLLKGAALAALLLLPATASATPQTLPRHTADKMGRMYVLYKGRVCPLQTFAKDFTTKLTGNATYHGLTPEQVLGGYLFYFDEWQDEPCIKIKGADELGVARHAAINDLRFLDTASITPHSGKNLRAANEKYSLVRMVKSGKGLKLFPVEGQWYGQNDELPLSVADDEYIFIRRWQSYCQELVLNKDYDELDRLFDKTRQYQTGRFEENAVRTRAERLYNTLTTGRWLAMTCITLGLLFFAYSLVQQRRQKRIAGWLKSLAVACVSVLTALFVAIFILRWIAGGHAPMAGGFDSMNLMSIVIGLLALALCRRHTMALPAGMLTIGFCQLVAMMSGSNPPVTNLMPVLNSPLLTLHVAVIMCAYALFFFVAMGGVAGLFADAEGYRRLNTLLLYPAVTLLAAGIIIGAVWANISWGNYWSWDPKEVWALITLIVYALPLHRGVLRRPWAFHLYCVLAFLSVIVTYFGVNLLLGGMHAYN
ncbi:MAG: cytochrome c biogenesis protein CcsA [Bacteroidales bacterium]|nr:cytochrome c biogenesis protein CcsA [Bacteroidales bacterium]